MNPKQILSSRRLQLHRRHKIHHCWVGDLILPNLQTSNLACCCSMDVGRFQETKDFIIHSTASSIMFVLVPFDLWSRVRWW